MNFTEQISKGVSTVANGVFGNLQTKEKAQFIILEMIKLSCEQYNKDEHFKKWINYVGDRRNHAAISKIQTKPEKMMEDK